MRSCIRREHYRTTAPADRGQPPSTLLWEGAALVPTNVKVTEPSPRTDADENFSKAALFRHDRKGWEDISDTIATLVEVTLWPRRYIILHSPAELNPFLKALDDGSVIRGAAVRSFICAWSASETLSLSNLVHLACIVRKLTNVVRLVLPSTPKGASIIAYSRSPSTETVPTILSPSSFVDLFVGMRPMSHLRVLDVTLELLVRLESHVVQNVTCLTVRIVYHEQLVACNALSKKFGRTLRSLRVVRNCFGQSPDQESPTRIWERLELTGLTYFELRDINKAGAQTAMGIDALAHTILAKVALHNVPMLTTIVWEPCWAGRCSEADLTYQWTVRRYLEDLLAVFGEGLVFLCNNDTDAQLLGRDLERLIPFTRGEVGKRWWEDESWGEIWSEFIQIHAARDRV